MTLYKDSGQFSDYEQWLLTIGSKIQSRQTYADYLLIKLRTQEANDKTVELGVAWLALYALDKTMASGESGLGL